MKRKYLQLSLLLVLLGYLGVQISLILTISNSGKQPITKWAADNSSAPVRSRQIFYNIFLPSQSLPKYNTALEVIKNHTQQIRNLLQTSESLRHEEVILNYVLIGEEFPHPGYFEQEICTGNNIKCKMIAHLKKGHEEHVLQAMYEYCLNQPAEANERVTYLHSKGTYSPSPAQNKRREDMTAAALDQNCLGAKADQCSACGSHFYWIPFPHYSGNMFTASCEYIKKLLPPFESKHKMNLNADRAFKLVNDPMTNLTSILSHRRSRSPYFGGDRYANEHWLGSHPEFVPCRILISSSVDGTSLYSFKTAPISTESIYEQINDLFFNRVNHTTQEGRLNEHAFLKGRMLLWNRLYNGARPPLSSWFWKAYPDGEYFKNLSFDLM